MIAAAALLGVVGGVATGYTVQAERPPTPLPPLSQPDLAYPKKRLPADQTPEPLSAAEDRRVKTDGDLRKLLLPVPKGARENHKFTKDNWLSIGTYSERFSTPADTFRAFGWSGLRRVAHRAWDEGDRTYIINLVQFRDAQELGAKRHMEEQQNSMLRDGMAQNVGSLLEGTEWGRYYVFDKPVRRPGYPPMYATRAIAHRGDVTMDIFAYDTRPMSKKDIRTIAERQVGML
ncbi:hypothetical protein H3147_01940 [Streptomyces sp. OF8]|uniref:Uncharacterized protein n=1 Tax=Streptomyces alkaliterrae TaxID=2213162 RepID=A0A5P0YV73_9ACTN|nr:hypothetical protein [Streptomyces alkaliterrae]MQS03372.1 hypothetical protein [Streptomyces alkaliterrae]